MLLHNDKEYYPLEIRKIISKNNETVYDRDNRKKSYFYIELNSDNKENN